MNYLLKEKEQKKVGKLHLEYNKPKGLEVAKADLISN